jgi:hypothetical protein
MMPAWKMKASNCWVKKGFELAASTHSNSSKYIALELIITILYFVGLLLFGYAHTHTHTHTDHITIKHNQGHHNDC